MRRMRFAAPLVLGLATASMPFLHARAQVSIGFIVTVAPPILPVYVQPPIPEPGYIWAPGYWAWSDASGYYWVPGTWVLPPEVGVLWTPGYWGCDDGVHYGWHPGYWGPHVGFYGGVNYGYGYTGDGYQGGYWQQNHFFYNRNVNNFGSTHVTNVYERNVTNVTVNRISYNGGNGGISRRPSQQEMTYQSERHFDPTADQTRQEQLAAGNRQMFAAQNHGVPPIAATARPGDFSGHNVVPAHNAPVRVPEMPHQGNAMMPQRVDQGMAPQHAGNTTAPQHEVTPVPRVVTPNAMMPQRPDQGMAPQHSNAMMAPQHEVAPAPRVVTPNNDMGMRPGGMNMPPVHSQPAYHAPSAPAYHPAQIAPHPMGMQPAYRPQAPAPRPENHPPEQGQEHKPN